MRTVRSGMRDVDRQTAVHGARMQLSRLGQTNGEPHRHDTGETAKDGIPTHGSNIDYDPCYDRVVGAARAI